MGTNLLGLHIRCAPSPTCQPWKTDRVQRCYFWKSIDHIWDEEVPHFVRRWREFATKMVVSHHSNLFREWGGVISNKQQWLNKSVGAEYPLVETVETWPTEGNTPDVRHSGNEEADRLAWQGSPAVEGREPTFGIPLSIVKSTLKVEIARIHPTE